MSGPVALRRSDTRPAPSPIELARLRQAVETSGEVIFMTDPSGLIDYVNPEFVHLYGYEPSEIVGRATPRILRSGKTPPEDYASFWAQLQGNQIVRREFLNRTKSGDLVVVDSSVSPIVGDDGVVVGFLAVQRDVTDRKRLERQFLQAQRMEAIGRLAGGVAHDFNNLLTAILGYGELLQDRVSDRPDVAADLAEITKAGERASRLTQQLLAFSRTQVWTPQVFNLNAVVGELHRMLTRVIGEDVRLEIVAEPKLARTKADPAQIEQLITNLAVNARDAMPQGGTLRIATANVELDADFVRRHEGAVPGRYVSLTAQDTGSGMSHDVLAHVFEPFFTTKPLGKGTGLGLSTVYSIVKQSGGYVTIDSAPGAGTTVTVYLPAAREEIAAPVTAADRAEPSGRETILIVEDEPDVRDLMQRALARYGYTILKSRNVHDAIEIAGRHDGTIDLLLSDVVMPDLSGPDLAQRIVRLRPDIQVLYVSGFTRHPAVQGGSMSPRAAFFPKPFTPEALATKVRECLDRRTTPRVAR